MVSNSESITGEEENTFTYALRINDLVFDLTVADDVLPGWKQLFISSNKNKSHCVFMTYRERTYDNNDELEKLDAPNVSLQALYFDSSCTTSGTDGMERGFGTFSMLIGALHAMISFARSSLHGPAMGHLRRFIITDKSYFSCPKFDTQIEIIVTRVILTGKSYYEDRIGARPVHLHVVRLLEAVNTRLEGGMYDAPALKKCIFDDRTASSSANRVRQQEWLRSRKNEICSAIDEHAAQRKKPVREFYTNMQKKYGCPFLACCWNRLSDYYGMGPLRGSEWVVSFDDVPPLLDSNKFSLTSKQNSEQTRRGGCGGLRRRTGGVCDRRPLSRRVRDFIIRTITSNREKCTMVLPNHDELRGKPLTRPSDRPGAFNKNRFANVSR